MSKNINYKNAGTFLSEAGSILRMNINRETLIAACLILMSTGCGLPFPERPISASAIMYSISQLNGEETPESDYPSNGKEITSFRFRVFENNALTGDVAGLINGTNIEVTLPYGGGVTSRELVPVITISGASISPAGGEEQDFSLPVTYTVSGEDGATQEYSVTVKLACPSGFIAVPGNSDYPDAALDFCVAKYEMKEDGSGDAVSQADLKPWVSLDRDAAIAACQALGTGYDLISNDQWQTIARNIEQVASNWNEGSVGLEWINKGHYNNNPSRACDGNYEYVDTDCDNSGNESDFVNKRTHTLSNGEVIWDLAGNVEEWISDDYGTDFTLTYPQFAGQYYFHFSLITELGFNTIFGPKGDYLMLDYAKNYGGLGSVTFGTGGAAYRGGAYNDSFSGIYALELRKSESYTSMNLGFRCILSQ